MNLSKRELQMLLPIAQGLNGREIAQALNVAEATVRTYTHRIRMKLGAKNIVALVVAALAHGILEINDGKVVMGKAWREEPAAEPAPQPRAPVRIEPRRVQGRAY